VLITPFNPPQLARSNDSIGREMLRVTGLGYGGAQRVRRNAGDRSWRSHAAHAPTTNKFSYRPSLLQPFAYENEHHNFSLSLSISCHVPGTTRLKLCVLCRTEANEKTGTQGVPGIIDYLRDLPYRVRQKKDTKTRCSFSYTKGCIIVPAPT